ncbi:VOC family protein [Kitasatospora azatica]|uniref:VOC family protein n=1 Tax=Kitasatospora azatica TaxID=58347 RepID=UPI0007C6D802|nr:VOC family protein [Kitasatospora azatica]
MSTRLTAVVVEALEVRALAEFWARALEWESAPGDGRVVVRSKAGDGVELWFVPSERPKQGKNRLHLDLAGGEEPPSSVRRLLALGAERVDIGQGAVPWEVLADPEGNEFCVLPVADTGGPLVQLCQDAADPRQQGRFWAEATGWTVVEQGSRGVRLRGADPPPAFGRGDPHGPTLVMGPPVAPKSGTNRLRFALTAAGAADQLLTDPEGNEYHLVTGGGGAAPGTRG